MRQNKLWNWIIVAACIALVAMPLLTSRFRTEVANWHLASAANSVKFGEDGFEESLTKASDSGVQLGQLHNFWLLSVEAMAKSSPEGLAKVVRDARKAGVDYRIVGAYAFALLQAQDDHENSVLVQEASLSPEGRASASMLNELAYLRSLAGFELEQALEDIDAALAALPDDEKIGTRSAESAFRDTRAWVLFQMNRVTEAAEDADRAIELLDELKAEVADDAGQSKIMQWFTSALKSLGFVDPGPMDLNEDGILNEREAGSALWSEGVLRYHRACIMEALGNEAKATEDFDWLKEQKLPMDETLH